MAWIAEPLTFYGLVAMGLLICLVLFVFLIKENSYLRQVLERDRRLTAGKMDEFRGSMVRLQGALEQAYTEAKTQVESSIAEPPDAQST